MVLVEPVHFGRGHQEAVGIAFTPRTERVDRAAVTGAGHDLLAHAAMRMMIEDVAGDDGGHPMAGREVRQIMEAQLIARTAAQGQGQIRSEEHTSELQSLLRISYAV